MELLEAYKKTEALQEEYYTSLAKSMDAIASALSTDNIEQVKRIVEESLALSKGIKERAEEIREV